MTKHRYPLGIALLSASVLLTEIGLTRLVSVLYYPPLAFAILALAVLGIGLGAALAALRADLRTAELAPLYVAVGASSLLVILLLATVALSSTGFPLFLAFIIVPFACVGLALAALFSQRPTQGPQLYMADLLGAGAGALLSVWLFNWLGGINGLLCAATCMAGAGILVGRVSKLTHRSANLQNVPRLMAAVATLCCLSLVVFNAMTGFLRIDMRGLPVSKPEREKLHSGGQLLKTYWDAFARTDLIDPGGGAPYELYMDGAAGSVMPPVGGDRALLRDIGFFPFATEQPQSAFIIGPGGGLDVWFGLQSGAQEIVAVEVNPASVALVREYATYNGDIYGQPAVRVLVDEGRSVLRREARVYDLIFLSQVVTLAAERSGYALVENSTYTIEAFGDYLDHLSPTGQIALKLYDEPTLTRALLTVLAAFERRGVATSEALNHIIVLLDPQSEPPIPLLLVRNAPYARNDVLSIGAVADRVGFRPLYLPGAWAEPPLDRIADGSDSLAELMAQAENDLAPTTDDRPFFFQFERGIPTALRPLLAGMALLVLAGGAWLWRVQRKPRTSIAHADGAAPHPLFTISLYFAALGAGFMLAEVGLMQQTRLFLGHPTQAITLVLATLLVGGGVGSAMAGRWGQQEMALVRWPLAIVLAWMVLWLLAWPALSQTFLASAQVVRILIVIGALLPLAFCLGMPFPLGLRLVGRWGGHQTALAWTVNGVMSVAGSLLAVALALLLGYRAVLAAAALFYLLSLLIVWRFPKTAYT